MTMHGDLSRFTFDPAKAYSSVREQQGRLHTDADGNEQVDILLHDQRSTRMDIIGDSGAPVDDAGMAVVSVGAGLRISTGRYYVNGLRCENRAPGASSIDFVAQPWVPGATLPASAGVYVAYLDVWERPITAIQDPSLREVALGGPDTATRTQIVWQVKLLKVATPGPSPNCAALYPEWTALLAGSTGTLAVQVAPAAVGANPCVVAESAGFRGVENQLYRVQIHDIHPTDGPRYKWSRDNGAIVAAVVSQPSANRFVVDRLGPGGANGFDLGDWVELSDDDDDLLGRAGMLARIVDIEERNRLVLELPAAYTIKPNKHSQVRGWSKAGVKPVAAAWNELEDGIQVRFNGTSFQPGDAWIVPARTAILPGTDGRQLEWPQVGGVAQALVPMVPRHAYAKLALLRLDGGVWTVLSDCRNLFASLTDMLSFDKASGDGQHERSGHYLPGPLVVSLMRGRFPVVQTKVRFSLVADPSVGIRGGLRASEPDAVGTPTAASVVEVVTDANGLARVWWQLGNAPSAEVPSDLYQRPLAQHVEARVLSADGVVQPLVTWFVATPIDDLLLVAAGGDGQYGYPGNVLPVALRTRVSAGFRTVPGARVRFLVMDDHFEGKELDQYSGGSLHASANLVSFVPWKNGSRMRSAVVSTDATGVAQVQWIVGTDVRLPIQRVMAYLLDNAGNDTAQCTLFTAQLAQCEPVVVDAWHWPSKVLLSENLRIPLSSFGELRFNAGLGLRMGDDTTVRIEAILPYSYANTGLKPAAINLTTMPVGLPTVLYGQRSLVGPEFRWSLNPIERETLTRVLQAEILPPSAGITVVVRVDAVADTGGRSARASWVRTFQLIR